jgi:hypothetical protein
MSGVLEVYPLTFNAVSNTTYRIAIDAWSANLESGSDTVLTWIQPIAPHFTLQPTNENIIISNNVTFSSMAIGVPAPTYQWRKGGVNVSGATDAEYTINNVQSSHAGDYTVVASNTSGSVTSVVATLTTYASATATFSLWNYSTNDEFRVHIAGVTNSAYIVQATTNFTDWVNVFTGVVSFNYTNSVSTNYPYRFFRALYNP